MNADTDNLKRAVVSLFSQSGDLFDVKMAVDSLVDTTTNIGDVGARVDYMVDVVKAMAGDDAQSATLLTALRRYLYESGPWNDHKPYQYDLDDPLGTKPENRLLEHYLITRRGNCVTMPMLMVIVGKRLGLEMTLAEAPLHVFVKYTDDDGTVWNLEATSGGGFTRDIWYRKHLPMSDRAIANGLYLRALSREETKALAASLIVDHELEAGRTENAIAVSDVILQHYPSFAYVLVKKGTAYALLIRRELADKYDLVEDIPAEVRTRADEWLRQNRLAFAHAEALGWSAANEAPR